MILKISALAGNFISICCDLVPMSDNSVIVVLSVISNPSSTASSPSATKSSGYGYADKVCFLALVV